MLAWKVFGSGLNNLAANAIASDAVTGLTATGTLYSDALELTNYSSVVTTTPAGSGVRLSSKATPGDMQMIYNKGANALNVYPPIGAQFYNMGTNVAFAVPTETALLMGCFTSTLWAI